MAVVYEDIDLGPVSEVAKEEFDLAKLEAEGWVTELRVQNRDARYLEIFGNWWDELVDEWGREVVAVKVNDELADVELVETEYDGWSDYLYRVERDMPWYDTIIKIYHNPMIAKDDTHMLKIDLKDAEGNKTPHYDILKCVKTVNEIVLDNVETCYSLPTEAATVSICARSIGPKISARGSVYANAYEGEHLDVHLAKLPGCIATDTDCTFFVPYHLLGQAKNNPDYEGYTQHIDALLPASQMPKLYRHEITLRDNWIYKQEGEEDRHTYYEYQFSFRSTRSTPFLPTEESKINSFDQEFLACVAVGTGVYLLDEFEAMDGFGVIGSVGSPQIQVVGSLAGACGCNCEYEDITGFERVIPLD